MTHSEFMLRAITLAKKGIGAADPNPLVGAVIVKNGKIIGEGYHARYGDLHAERNAINNLTESAEGATIYVTLEPCCHYGKQPPCTEAILRSGIKKVVIGSRDPNPVVSGKGARLLREKGIEVTEDFMKEECDLLNPVFFHYITTGLPYVVIKYAMTADGKIAARTGASKWITGEEARAKVQQLRYQYMGIMAGIGTVMADDPMLNVRIEGKRSPVRIICDSRLQIPADCKIVNTAKTFKTLAVCALPKEAFLNDIKLKNKRRYLEEAGVEVISVPGEKGRVDLKELMRLLGKKGISSILLEGGGTLNCSALEAGIVNEVKAFIAPKIFGGEACKTPVEGRGVDEPFLAYPLEFAGTDLIGDDILINYRVKRREE